MTLKKAHHNNNDSLHAAVHFIYSGTSCRSIFCSLVQGAAVTLVLYGGDHLVYADTDGGQDAEHVLNGLLRQSGLPAQDPRQLLVEQTVVRAAVHQSVAVIVGGQNPVWTGRRVCNKTVTSRVKPAGWFEITLTEVETFFFFYFRRRRPPAWRAQQDL